MSAEASSSAPRLLSNHQSNPNARFAYPLPTPADLEDELPPYFEDDNVPLGGLLERVTRKGYGDMKELVEVTLDRKGLSSRQKAQHVVNYAKSTRHNILKYLAILRWKQSVDLPYDPAIPGHNDQSPPNPLLNGLIQYHTPLSNEQSPAAGGYVGKGKAKAVDLHLGLDTATGGTELERRGKVTDAKRIAVFMEHQNRQHDEAIGHLKFQASVVESFRERNPDILTALSLLTQGTYTRLPTSLTKAFLPQTPLTNASILKTLRRLNKHLTYRLRCIDHLPPELEVLYIRDGRVRLQGGHGEWKVDVTVVGFGDESRWWTVGLEWGWRVKEKGVDDPGGGIKIFEGEERQGVLDLVNGEIISARAMSKRQEVLGDTVINQQGKKIKGPNTESGVDAEGTPRTGSSVVGTPRGIPIAEEISELQTARNQLSDAPLIRLHNFIQHLSLSYQLEVLFTQAMTLSQGRWRGNLLVEIDRNTKIMKARYWVRARATPTAVQGQVVVGKRQATGAGPLRTPLVGGVLSISLEELKTRVGGDLTDLMGLITLSGGNPVERVLNLGLKIKWEVEEIGVGGEHKAGDLMDVSEMTINAQDLDFENLLETATRTHASHLTRNVTLPLCNSTQIALFPLDPPILTSSQNYPLSLHIPLPSRIAAKRSNLIVRVSAVTGLTEIEDQGKGDARQARAKLVEKGVNVEGGRLVDDVGRLMKAVITENLESQMRQFGWEPLRRLPLRSQDLAKADLHPASSIFVPLPTSSLHYLTARVTPLGLTFELLRLSRVAVEGLGMGMRMIVGDRTSVDVQKLRDRRAEKGKGKAKEESTLDLRSSFEVDDRDLQDVYIFCNALVAQTIVEQQLKDRSIPYTLQYPSTTGPTSPSSTSAVAGMVPTLCVNAKDLFKDGIAGEVAMPKVYIQLRDWWKGGKVTTLTVVQLRHKTALTPGKNGSATDDTAEAGTEGIKFDPANSTVRFKAEDIGRCVPAFLEQWERLSKVIGIAGEVNRLNKSPRFQSLRMLSFDLKTATFAYHPGYIVTVTYSPLDDSHEVTFGCESAGEDEVEGGNPHESVQGLLGHKLNELVATRKKGSVGLEFISLLCDTLPFLLECRAIDASKRIDTKVKEDIFPAIVIRSVSAFKLVWDVGGVKRYLVDFILLPSNDQGKGEKGGRYLVRDGFGTGDGSCGPLTGIEEFEGVVSKLWDGLRARATGGDGVGEKGIMAMKMDGGKSLVVGMDDARWVVREVVREVDGILGL